MSKITLLFILSFGLVTFCFSQEKFEKESRIKVAEVPEEAKDWLKDSFEKAKRIKWYLEYSQNGRSYEAKFNYLGYFHSVEFDSLGNILDVEVEIEKEEVDSKVWDEIQAYFDSNYEQVKVEKIQRQFTGDADDLEDFFDEGENAGVTIRYEIIFEGKKEQWELWEVLFDQSGSFLTLFKVQIRLNDNLIF